jgi:DNA-binding NarL/FixJ family response regulator
MPEMNGYEAARVIQKKFPTVNVLMLTMYDSELSADKITPGRCKRFSKKGYTSIRIKICHSLQ